MCLVIIDCIIVLLYYCIIDCVMMPLHDGQVGSLPPSGHPPTPQVSPAGYMLLCSPHGDQ